MSTFFETVTRFSNEKKMKIKNDVIPDAQQAFNKKCPKCTDCDTTMKI
jgi:hypothetical protein